MKLSSITVANDDGTVTTIPVRRDACGWTADHDNHRIYLSVVRAYPSATAPPKA